VKSFLQACKTVFDLKDRDLFEHSDLMEIAGFGKVCDYDIALVYLFKHFVANST